ncbi:hypothetical protein [Streptomyces sp. NPDC000878]
MSALRRADVVETGGGGMGAGAWTARTGADGIGLGVQDLAAAWAVVHAAWGEGR